MKTLYNKVFSLKFFAKLLENKFLGKVLSYEFLSYLFFGVMTTVVNLGTFWLCDRILGAKELFSFTLGAHLFKVTLEDVSTAIAWVVGVLFAYVTNKLWVFESKSWKPGLVVRELLSFTGARLLSFVLFESLGFMLVRNLMLPALGEKGAKWTAKLVTAVFVVVFNYAASKLVIFRKKEAKNDELQTDR